MRASIETRSGGCTALVLDGEAAPAVFASILFAARFHERIALLAAVAEEGLRNSTQTELRRQELCQ